MPKLYEMKDRESNRKTNVHRDWETWEAENADKNKACLAEMQSILKQFEVVDKELYELFKMSEESFRVPTEDDMWKLMQCDSFQNRIDDQPVFSLFWLTPEDVDKTHDRDFLSKFSYVGLDLIELRAVYACLPGNFVNDPDSSKHRWRLQVREKLYKMTEKERKGMLGPEERRHLVYSYLPSEIKLTL